MFICKKYTIDINYNIYLINKYIYIYANKQNIINFWLESKNKKEKNVIIYHHRLRRIVNYYNNTNILMLLASI
jgi:hypothetical protein